jgi:hypothetical protein
VQNVVNYGIHLPAGMVYDQDGKITLDPDRQVQDLIKLVFKKFQELKSARAVVKYFKDNKLRIPSRRTVNKGRITWSKLSRTCVCRILRNPLYAGAYACGRRTKGSKDIWLPMSK